MRRFVRSFFLGSLALALLAGACGDDDEGAEGTTAGGEIEVEQGLLSADDLRDCLADAGFEPEDDDALAFGVDDPFDKLEVELDPDGTDSRLIAELYVFESEAAAEDNRVALTLQTEDTERNRLVGNVVLSYTIVPSFDRDGADAVEACLEP